MASAGMTRTTPRATTRADLDRPGRRGPAAQIGELLRGAEATAGTPGHDHRPRLHRPGSVHRRPPAR